MLSDMLGVAIGFATVMFLLSLFVTMLAQMVQYVIGLRGKNLARGVQLLLNEASKGKDGEPPSAETVLRDYFIKPWRFEEESFLEKLLGWWEKRRLPQWVKWEELERILEDEGLLTNQGDVEGSQSASAAKQIQERVEKTRQSLKAYFDSIELRLRDRFATWMRFVTLVCALIVAFWYQLSVPQLLTDLFRDPELRETAAALGTSIVENLEGDRSGEDVSADASEEKAPVKRPAESGPYVYRKAAADAIAELIKENEDLSGRLNKLTGQGLTLTALLEEAKDVLDEKPQLTPAKRAAVLADYEALVMKHAQEEVFRSLREATEASKSLATLNIVPWQHGWEFYRIELHKDKLGESLGNWLGVLITAAFLSLGSDFWFNQLRRFVKLRDTLAAKQEEDARTAAKAPPNGQQQGQNQPK